MLSKDSIDDYLSDVDNLRGEDITSQGTFIVASILAAVSKGEIDSIVPEDLKYQNPPFGVNLYVSKGK